jgi:hypothetical protein
MESSILMQRVAVFSTFNAHTNEKNLPVSIISILCGSLFSQELTVEGTLQTDSIHVEDFVGFSVRLNAVLSSTTDNSYTTISGWTTSIDQGDHFFTTPHFNTSTGIFTAPQRGYYFFAYSIRLDDLDGTFYRAGLSRNGNNDPDEWITGNVFASDTTSAYMSLTNSCVTKLEKNATVEVMIYQSGDTNVNIDKESWFSGYLISLF